MKKFLIRGLIVVIILLAAFYFIVVPKTVAMITDYPRFTFESVTSDPDRLEIFDIGFKRNPGDYGFPDFQELEYKTIFDGLDLNGWYVPSSNDSASKTLVISHGRTSNRLKTMKYLEIIKDYGLDSIYHVFIPDLRNSGKSAEAKTGMGYEFAEDIVGSMKMLQVRFGHNNFALWGFSMGAMASATSVNRPDLQKILNDSEIEVEKLILASPLSNVHKTLKVASQDRNIPGFLFDITFNKFSKQSEGYVENMKMSYLLKNNRMPALVLYSTTDIQTPSAILEEELMGLSHLKIEKFDGVEHVRIYTTSNYKERYAEAVNAFLRN